MKCIAPQYAKGSSRSYPTYVPCGRCGYCLKNRQLDWTLRLGEEFKISPWSWFITLTYSPESLPRNFDEHELLRKHFPSELDKETLKVRDLQLFTKSLRKYNMKNTDLQLRYYACGEYGSRTGRPHYHAIFFNLHPKTLRNIDRCWTRKKKPIGIMDVQLVQNSDAVSNYVASYIVSAYAEQLRLNLKPFSVMSKKPYLGHTYVKRMTEYHRALNQPYLKRGEIRQRLPRKFVNEIFDQTAKNSWKQPGIEQQDLRINAELHRLYLLNGFDYDGFNSIERTKITHEHTLRNNLKKGKF